MVHTTLDINIFLTVSTVSLTTNTSVKTKQLIHTHRIGLLVNKAQIYSMAHHSC